MTVLRNQIWCDLNSLTECSAQVCAASSFSFSAVEHENCILRGSATQKFTGEKNKAPIYIVI